MFLGLPVILLGHSGMWVLQAPPASGAGSSVLPDGIACSQCDWHLIIFLVALCEHQPFVGKMDEIKAETRSCSGVHPFLLLAWRPPFYNVAP